MSQQQLVIGALGAQGDGVATVEGRQVFVPFALPGETVTAEVDGNRARLLSVDTPSPDRRGSRCSQYGVCGGCSLQHMEETAYLAFKRAQVASALEAAGIDAEVSDTIACPPNSRRRAVYAATRTPDGVVVGFNTRRSGDVVALRDCAIVTPILFASLMALKQIIEPLVPARGHLDVVVADTLTGLDVAITNAGRGISADQRQDAARRAAESGVARLSVNGEVVLQHRQPMLKAGDSWVTPPPGGFLQASAWAEDNMVRLVTAAVGGARRIADLFAGSGTFSLPLASIGAVHAVESSEAALDAIRAARKGDGLKPVTVEKRDLFRRPMTTAELSRFEAVVLDPPRAGAEAQCAQLAPSKVRRVAMVSCNALTFARDLRILVQGGYRIEHVTPVDQFLYSPHIEIVAALHK